MKTNITLGRLVVGLGLCTIGVLNANADAADDFELPDLDLVVDEPEKPVDDKKTPDLDVPELDVPDLDLDVPDLDPPKETTDPVEPPLDTESPPKVDLELDTGTSGEEVKPEDILGNDIIDAPVDEPPVEPDTAMDEDEPKSDPLKEKKMTDMTLAELRSFQRYNYIPGGRDPLMFRLPVDPETIKDPTKTRIATERGGPPTSDALLKQINKSIITMEVNMLVGNFDVVIDMGGTIKEDVEHFGGIQQGKPELSEAWRKLLRYLETAKRLKSVAQKRAEFGELKLAVKGIRWTPYSASVLINERVYEPGSLIDGMPPETTVQLENVDESGATFVYKGQRFRKTVDTKKSDEK
jgi:hypothetical protein